MPGLLSSLQALLLSLRAEHSYVIASEAWQSAAESNSLLDYVSLEAHILSLRANTRVWERGI